MQEIIDKTKHAIDVLTGVLDNVTFLAKTNKTESLRDVYSNVVIKVDLAIAYHTGYLEALQDVVSSKTKPAIPAIDTLGFSQEFLDALANNGIETTEQLLATPISKLKSNKDFSIGNILYIDDSLRRFGLSLAK